MRTFFDFKKIPHKKQDTPDQRSEDILHVLYIEDDDAVRIANTQALNLAGIPVFAVEDAETAVSLLKQSQNCIVVSDVWLPGASGMDLLIQVQEIDPRIPVILVTGHGDIAMAVRAIQNGAYDFLEKPYSSDFFIDMIRRALEKRNLTLENDRLKRELQLQHGPTLIGFSASMVKVRQQITDLADTQVDILIEGETGTGKEVVAKALHNWSKRRSGRYVAVNCSGLPETVFESEMFGYEAGAFTGAQKKRIGHIEYANGGTLFLDEIEGMALGMQAKMLRVLQEKEIERLGSNTLIPIDCRIVAATKENLMRLSDEGKFRRDLWYRLNVVTITLPPLRERTEDIVPLFMWFASKAAERYQKDFIDPQPEFLDLLLEQKWPGNVRELKNIAERYVLGMVEDKKSVAGEEETETLVQVNSLAITEKLLAYERKLIEKALQQNNGKVVDAACQLGIPRKTLYDKLARFGINPFDYRSVLPKK